MTPVLQPLHRAIAQPQQIAASFRALSCLRPLSQCSKEALRPSASYSLAFLGPRPAAVKWSPLLPNFNLQRARTPTPILARTFVSSAILREAKPIKPLQENTTEAAAPPVPEVVGFAPSEKASRAAQVNLSARLNKDGKAPGTKPGWSEIVRLLKIARPEARWLGGGFCESALAG